MTFQTAHGQLLDLITAPQGQAVDLSKYTLDNYLRIVTYKTAYYTFYLPVACGMLLAGVQDEAAYKVAEPILVEMGQYFQVCLLTVPSHASWPRRAGGPRPRERFGAGVAMAAALIARTHARCVRRSRTTTWTATATQR